MIDLWMNGYVCTGAEAPAKRCGIYDTDDIREAITQWANEDPDKRWGDTDLGKLSFWGRRFFVKHRLNCDPALLDEWKRLQKRIVEVEALMGLNDGC